MHEIRQALTMYVAMPVNETKTLQIKSSEKLITASDIWVWQTMELLVTTEYKNC